MGSARWAIQRQTGKGKPTIWRWQARFMAEGVDGLLHEATRPAGKPALPETMLLSVQRVAAPVAAPNGMVIIPEKFPTRRPSLGPDS